MGLSFGMLLCARNGCNLQKCNIYSIKVDLFYYIIGIYYVLYTLWSILDALRGLIRVFLVFCIWANCKTKCGALDKTTVFKLNGKHWLD